MIVTYRPGTRDDAGYIVARIRSELPKLLRDSAASRAKRLRGSMSAIGISTADLLANQCDSLMACDKESGACVGFSLSRKGELVYVHVDRGFRGHGIGRRLIEATHGRKDSESHASP